MRKCLFVSAAAFIAIACVVLLIQAMLPPRPGVTRANCNRIQDGISQEEVERMFGGPPSRNFGQDDSGLSALAWYGNDDAAVVVVFKGGVVHLAHYAIWHEPRPLSLSDKIRRWLGLP